MKRAFQISNRGSVELMRVAMGVVAVTFGLLLTPHLSIGQNDNDKSEAPFQLQGVVVEPDGTPSKGAKVFVGSNWPNSPNRPPVSALCDDQGKFSGLESRFGFTTIIHAESANGEFHSEMIVPDFLARTTAAAPLRIQLTTADEVQVTVTSGDQPVSNCKLVVDRLPGADTFTNAQGVATVRFPKNCEARQVSAFHSTRGIGAWKRKVGADNPETIDIALEAPAQHTFRVIDQYGSPVPEFDLTLAIRMSAGIWIYSPPIAAAHIQTGKDGTVGVPWVPANQEGIEPIVGSAHWQVDEYTTTGNTTELLVRKKHSFIGQVRFPDDQTCEGVLLVASSFGPKSLGDHSQTRTDRNGKFRIYLAPDHVYLLGVRDLKWASETRAGVFLRTEGDSTVYLSRGTILDAVPATQVEVKVVDEEEKPLDSIWVNFGLTQKVEWVDAAGKKRNGNGSIHHWLRTDANGTCAFGTLPGKVEIRATKNEWSQTKELEIKDSPITVLIKREPSAKEE